MLGLIKVGGVLAQGIGIVFLRRAIRKDDSEANLGEPSLSVVGGRDIRRNLRVRSEHFDKWMIGRDAAIGDFWESRLDVSFKGLSSGESTSCTGDLRSEGKNEIFAEESRILAVLCTTATITLQERVLIVIKSRDLKWPLVGKDGRLAHAVGLERCDVITERKWDDGQ